MSEQTNLPPLESVTWKLAVATGNLSLSLSLPLRLHL